jgi:hypothetical protein
VADWWARHRPNSAGVMPATLSPLPDRKGGFTHTQPSQANLTAPLYVNSGVGVGGDGQLPGAGRPRWRACA